MSSNCPLNIEMSCIDAVPAGSIPNGLRFWPQTMIPLLALIVRANNNIRRVSAFGPLDQTQQGAVIRLVRGNPQCALPEFPSPRSVETVTHAGNHEETIKVIQRTLLC